MALSKIKERSIEDAAITTTKIADDAVATAKLADNAVSGAKFSGTQGVTLPTITGISPTVITNDATNITITGANYASIPRVQVINTATGIWYNVNTVTFNNATSLTVNLTLSVDASTYRIRVENPDGGSVISAANALTVSDAPTWTTASGSLGSFAGAFSGTIATLATSGDTPITYSETTNVLTNTSLAKCALNSSTGAITTTDFDANAGTARTHTFTIRATDAQSQTTDREFTLTSSYGATGSGGFN